MATYKTLRRLLSTVALLLALAALLPDGANADTAETFAGRPASGSKSTCPRACRKALWNSTTAWCLDTTPTMVANFSLAFSSMRADNGLRLPHGR